MLSTIADKTPTIELAIVGPNPSYNISETNDRYPIKPKPPTLKITPKKKSNVSHSALEIFLKKSNLLSSFLDCKLFLNNKNTNQEGLDQTSYLALVVNVKYYENLLH